MMQLVLSHAAGANTWYIICNNSPLVAIVILDWCRHYLTHTTIAAFMATAISNAISCHYSVRELATCIAIISIALLSAYAPREMRAHGTRKSITGERVLQRLMVEND